ncbi:LytR C-terminal domain-containing protein [Cellulomonas triticagri]|uniref:LytR family transcriptional regulator n=1 Tax=Cellulomonas triticagri TaxID=2483352 RepID=A0A3M2IX54_9CELL|nr:LytR C-terminal domain-containing protein [Cellulomonas triticagri]RMI05034.1 LytR family transcriptional regulator [Cellulomonas triticagri]
MSDRTPDAARQRRRRHTRERQAVVFGVLVGGLAVSAFGAAAVYTGSWTPPFLARDFSSPEPTGLAAANSPCPPEGATPVPYGEVALTVLNSTNRVGLAGDTASALLQRGFSIAAEGNAREAGYESYAGSALIQFGTQGVAQAYTVAAQFDTPQLVLDDREDASVDVVVGSSYSALVAAADVVLAADQPFAVPEGCIALDQVTPAPRPVPPPATEPPAEEAPPAEG